MSDYYVDNNVGGPGAGTFLDPWDDIASNVNSLSAGDTMHVRGDAGSARVYTEPEIDITPNGGASTRITLQPYLSELVCIKNDMTPGSHYTFDIHGTYWEIKDFEIDHNDSYAYGLHVRGSHTIIRDCEIHNSHAHNIVVDTAITDTEIRDNTIYDFDLPAADAHGIMLQIQADRTIVDGNTIHDCAGDGIQFHDGAWASAADSQDDCEITNNHFYRGSIARSEEGIDVKCSTGLTISGNTIHGYGRSGSSNPSSAGIKFTNQVSSGAVIEDNIIYNCANDGITLTGVGVSDTVLRRNLIYDITTRGIRVHSGGTGVDVYNNTVVDVGVNGLRVDTWTGGNLKNNLFADAGDLTLDGGGSMGATAEYNGRWDTTSDAEFVDAGTDTTGTGDPGFVNAAADDYRLISTSLAVDAGVDVGLDYYGDAPDLGYWEYEPLIPPIAVLREPGASLYKLRLKTAAGALIAEIVAFEELCYTKRINSPGLCTFKLDGDHTAIDQLEHRSQVEVWRANPDLQLDWHCDSYNLYLSPDRFQSERNIFTTVCPGQMWFLSTRIIAWYADTANRTKFTSVAAETIMKTLVYYNACAPATTGNGRLRDGAITGVSIVQDAANGNTLDWYCAYKNLLTELQGLAQVAGGDFDLIKTAAQAWEFRWYTGQRGNDRRGAIVFARERGNMINPRYLHDRLNEKTVAIVGGRKEKSERDVVIRTGDDYSAGNDVEVFVDAKNRSTTAGYNAAGDKRLSELRAREMFSFEVVQTPSCFYGEVASGGDYELGDLVTARAFGIEKEHQVVGVTVAVVPAAEYCEAIDIEVETPVTAP